MKIHERQQTSDNRKATCGYCGEQGHNQYDCKHVEADWKFLSKWQIPTTADGQPIKRGRHYTTWRSHQGLPIDPLNCSIYNNCFTTWFRACRKTLLEQRRRAALPRSQKKVTKRTCGFCGSTNHTRRNCTVMKQFVRDCGKANENWRRAAYAEIVQKHGVSVGAVIQVEFEARWNQKSETKMAIIKSINWDTVNVLSGCDKRSDFAHSPLEIKVLIGNETITLTGLEDTFQTIGKNGVSSFYWGSNAKLKKVITHSPTPLDPEWVTSYKESFDTLVKKRSHDQLRSGMRSEYSAPNIVAHVNAWK